jgi:hypothetical protein
LALAFGFGFWILRTYTWKCLDSRDVFTPASGQSIMVVMKDRHTI